MSKHVGVSSKCKESIVKPGIKKCLLNLDLCISGYHFFSDF